MTTLAQCMTPLPITVAPHDTVQQAARLMDQYNIGCLPVAERGELVGLITDRDITVRATCAGLAPDQTLVAQVMSIGVRTCHHRATVEEALRLMADVQIRRLPVLDDSGRLWGVVSMGDLLAMRAPGADDALRRICTPARPDRPEPSETAAPPARPGRGSAARTSVAAPAARSDTPAPRRLQKSTA